MFSTIAREYKYIRFFVKLLGRSKKLDKNKSLTVPDMIEESIDKFPNNIAISSRINRSFRTQRFREVFSENIDSSKQLSLPDLQQRNFLFDWNHEHFTDSINLKFSCLKFHLSHSSH